MKLTDFELKELVPYIAGENGLTIKRSGSKLVDLFKLVGQKDIYDFNNGGLPKLENNRTGLNTSRKDYTFDRLRKINDSINLKKIIELVVNDSETETEDTVNYINSLIISHGYKLENIGIGYEIIGAEEDEEIIEVEVTFKQIESKILNELDNAQFIVWIAVAWFTNDIIHKKLLQLKQKGINIQILIIDDAINKKHGCNIEAFESKRIPLRGYWQNKMHNKFCIIDLKTVLNGSYNYSSSANYNDENVTILRSRKVAEEFAKRFISLKVR